MTTIDTLKKIQSEVINILKQCKVRDGLTLSNDQLSNTDDILFWEDLVVDDNASKKETYIVFEIVSAQKNKIADDLVKSRNALVVLDIFTRKDKNSKKIINLLTELNSYFNQNNWEFEFNSSFMDNENQITQLSYNLTKEIK